jgi:rhodanese-related sulfurtransferase
MPITRGYRQLLDDALGRIVSWSPEEARAMLDDPDTLFVDIRDVRELEREGAIPGAFHAPRGMLEFWVDPESPYHKPVFASGKRMVLFCAGGWRSALATAALADMGLEPIGHMTGGFKAWREMGYPTQPYEKKSGEAQRS